MRCIVDAPSVFTNYNPLGVLNMPTVEEETKRFAETYKARNHFHHNAEAVQLFDNTSIT